MKFVELRKAAGYTQDRLAEVAGVTSAIVSHIERGRIQSSNYSTVAKLALALGTTAANVAAAIEESYQPEQAS